MSGGVLQRVTSEGDKFWGAPAHFPRTSDLCYKGAMKALVSTVAFCAVLTVAVSGQQITVNGVAVPVTSQPAAAPIPTLRHGRLALEDATDMLAEVAASSKAGKPWVMADFHGLEVAYQADDAESAALIAAATKRESDAQVAAAIAKTKADLAAFDAAVAARVAAMAPAQRDSAAEKKRRDDEAFCRANPPTPYGGALTGFLAGLHGCPTYIQPPPVYCTSTLGARTTNTADPVTVYTNCR